MVVRRRARQGFFAMPIALVAIGLALLVLVVSAPSNAWAAGASPAHATAKEKQKAQSHFTRGRDLYDKGKYEPALAELNLSLDAVVSPNTRLYVSRCLREMGRLVPAYVEFGRTMSDAKDLGERYQKTAQAAHDERALLEKKLGVIEIQIVHPGVTTRLNVAGEDVRQNDWKDPVAVVPGTIAVVVETTGKTPIKQSLEVNAGEKKSLVIDVEQPPAPPPPPEPVAKPTPPPPPVPSPEATLVKETVPEEPPKSADNSADQNKTDGRPRYRLIMYVGGGVAVLGMTTFIIAGAMANSTFSDLEEACGSGPCPQGSNHRYQVANGNTEQTVANLGLVVFVIGAAVAATMFVLDLPKSKAAPGKATAARMFLNGGYSYSW